MKFLPALLLSCLLFFYSPVLQGIGVGDPAPDFTLNTLGGGQITLSQLTGQVVFLYFLGYACPPCLAPTGGPATEFSIWQVYRNYNFQVIGIDCWDGTAAQLQDFRFNTGITYPLCLNGSNVCADYLAPASFSVVVNQSGIISYMGIGVDLPVITAVLDSLLGLTAINEEPVIINSFHLYQNFPNPFNPTTTIKFDLKEPSIVTLKIFNLSGQEVAVLIKEEKLAGTHIVAWSGEAFPGGVYFYRLQAGKYSQTRKLILLK